VTAAVVTGLAAAAPNGLGTEAYWAATLRGESGIAPISRYDAAGYPIRLAGEITDFVAADHITSRMLPQTDRITQVALAASDWALADARIEPARLPEFSAGVVIASAAGGHEFGQQELQKLWRSGSDHVSAYQAFAWFYAANTGQVSIRHGLRGTCKVVVAEQAGGLDALGQARREVRAGMDLMITGGLDSALCPWGLVAQIPNGRLSTMPDAARAYVPFDADASGYLPGEGGAVLVVEPAERAEARGCPRVYGELAGYAATFDPAPGRGRPPALRRAIELALADAGVAPGAVDVVFADASGVPELDRQEADALQAVFGPNGVPVTAPKTMTGRLLSGSATLDTVTALLSIRDGVLPPTVNTTDLAPGIRLDLVREPRPLHVDVAVVLARGHSGHNSAVVLRRTTNSPTFESRTEPKELHHDMHLGRPAPAAGGVRGRGRRHHRLSG
jgi:act minimal PKS chain-length factor (CLF/KS beta)